LSVIEARRVAQYYTGEGPCLESLYRQHTVRLSDMATETRWPWFTARVGELNVASMLSFQLYVEHDNLGALNLYSRDTDAFTDESEQVGLLFATHAALAMADARNGQQLTRALAEYQLFQFTEQRRAAGAMAP
jgi:GAF domain-containing protein